MVASVEPTALILVVVIIEHTPRPACRVGVLRFARESRVEREHGA